MTAGCFSFKAWRSSHCPTLLCERRLPAGASGAWCWSLVLVRGRRRSHHGVFNGESVQHAGGTADRWAAVFLSHRNNRAAPSGSVTSLLQTSCVTVFTVSARHCALTRRLRRHINIQVAFIEADRAAYGLTDASPAQWCGRGGCRRLDALTGWFNLLMDDGILLTSIRFMFGCSLMVAHVFSLTQNDSLNKQMSMFNLNN